MSDPLRTGERTASAALPPGAHDPRIERLLLQGLDHYFGGRYDQAINRWTRVLFVDRRHDRARAYIDRARRAQAESARESEALVSQGADALDAGDLPAARALVDAALASGAPQDTALVLLGRIERLESAQNGSKPRLTLAEPEPAAARLRQSWRRRRAAAIAVVAVTVSATAALALALWYPAQPTTTPISPIPSMPLPVMSRADLDLASAEAHFASGRVRDALALLDRLPLGSRARERGQALRDRIYRELLAAGESELRAGRARALAPALEPAAPR